MLTEICQELRNWFDRDMVRGVGDFQIVNGSLVLGEDVPLLDGQYFRITGSVFNNGVHQWPASDLTDEEFTGVVQGMAIPKELVDLSAEIEEWQNLYGSVNSQAMSPFGSESFGGYAYTKGSRSSASGAVSDYPSWQTAFASRLNKWRKI